MRSDKKPNIHLRESEVPIKLHVVLAWVLPAQLACFLFLFSGFFRVGII